MKKINGVREVEKVRRIEIKGVEKIREDEIMMEEEMEDMDGIEKIEGEYEFMN